MLNPGVFLAKNGLLEADFLMADKENFAAGLSFRWSFERDSIGRLTGPYERPERHRRRIRARPE